MNVVVAMPWRPQPGRQAAHDFTVAWYHRLLPEAHLVEVDTDHDEYNLAAARNLGVREAEAVGAEVVVITDADTIIAPDHHLLDAIREAAADGRMHMPFTQQRYLDETETARWLDQGLAPSLDGGGVGNGACYVTRPGAYWTAGGSDERFSGYGGDDDQLVAATTCLVGLVRHPGVALSLWHPACRDIGSERHRPNAELAHRYWAAITDREAMQALIAERDGAAL